MITRIRLVFCLFVFSSTVSFHASGKDCLDPEGSGLWADCRAANALEAADAQLNVAYRKLMFELKKNKYVQEVKNLTTAQRLWIKYRQEYCNVVGNLRGGSPDWQASYFTRCRAEVAIGRTAELEQLYKDVFEQ